MKKKIIVLIATGVLILSMVGCGNRKFVDTTYTFEKAIIALPNGDIVQGEIQSWKDFADGDQIQVKIDGKTYLTHIENAVLISE